MRPSRVATPSWRSATRTGPRSPATSSDLWSFSGGERRRNSTTHRDNAPMRILLAPLWVQALCWALVGAVVAVLASMFSADESHRPILLNWPAGTLFFVVFTVVFAAMLTWRTQDTRQTYLAQVQG